MFLAVAMTTVRSRSSTVRSLGVGMAARAAANSRSWRDRLAATTSMMARSAER